MKHAPNPRRGRNRNAGKRNHSSKNRNFESSGPDTKVRGTAQQILDKYLVLARDATSSGDRIMAEGYFQHAEHYYRVLNADRGETPTDQQQHGRQDKTENARNNDNRQDKPDQQATSADKPAEPVAEMPAPAQPQDSKPQEPDSEKTEPDQQETPQASGSEDQKPRRRGRPRKTVVKSDSEGETPAEPIPA